ncbi:hypothetical protein FXO38_02970 [Capsicum annuum]|nr:hypothetical protein FXO38_02970 [Capsicum annuum]KAF3681106.1 hypothetical protein FXO37_03042 [Capsicum annuum]
MQLKLQRAEVTDIAIAAFPAPTKIQTKINSVIQEPGELPNCDQRSNNRQYHMQKARAPDYPWQAAASNYPICIERNHEFGYGQVKCKLTGFIWSVHIWKGMDDQVVPHQMTDYVARILPRVVVHKLPNEGHFSYFFFCEECYRKMFLTIFESPHGPLEEIIEAPIEDYGYQEAANLAMAAE